MIFKHNKAISPLVVVASVVTTIAVALFIAVIQGWLSLDRSKLRFDLLSKVSAHQSQVLVSSLNSAHTKLALFKKEATGLHQDLDLFRDKIAQLDTAPVSYTHLRAHETGRNLVCRLLLEKKK